eukprot:1603489-Rhodomonas_salina.4
MAHGLDRFCMGCKDVVIPPVRCWACRTAITGSYFQTDDGPECESCNANPPQVFVYVCTRKRDSSV